MIDRGDWRARRARRERRYGRAGRGTPSVRGLAFLLGIAMAVGFIVPPIVSRTWNGDTMIRWTWHFFEALGESNLPEGAFAGILFFVLTPFVGAAAALAARLSPRGSLSAALLVLGLIPIGCTIGGIASLQTGMGAYTVVYFGAQMLLLAGAAVGAKRPDRPVGFRLTATAGSLMLILSVLPLAPKPGGGTTSFVQSALKALDAPEYGALLFVMLMLPLVAALVGLTTAGGDQEGRRKRALATLWISVASFLLWFVVPMVTVLDGPPGSVGSVFFLLTSILLLRMYPALGLVVLGLSGLIFRYLPAETDLEEIFA